VKRREFIALARAQGQASRSIAGHARASQQKRRAHVRVGSNAIRIANPEVSVTQNRPLIVEQDGPFTMQQPGPLKIDAAELTIKTEQLPAGSTKGPDGETKTTTGDVIKREVTVFWSVSHGAGQVVTGWSYPDGRGGVPVVEYCYYDAAQMDGSFKRINIARNRVPSSVTGLVPDLQGALAKCQWWQV
jgi:hypothetical protein